MQLQTHYCPFEPPRNFSTWASGLYSLFRSLFHFLPHTHSLSSHAHTHTHTHTNTHTHANTNTHKHKFTHKHTQTHTSTNIYTHTHTHKHTHMHTHTHTHIHTHTPTHTTTGSSFVCLHTTAFELPEIRVRHSRWQGYEEAGHMHTHVLTRSQITPPVHVSIRVCDWRSFLIFL